MKFALETCSQSCRESNRVKEDDRRLLLSNLESVLDVDDSLVGHVSFSKANATLNFGLDGAHFTSDSQDPELFDDPVDFIDVTAKTNLSTSTASSSSSASSSRSAIGYFVEDDGNNLKKYTNSKV